MKKRNPLRRLITICVIIFRIAVHTVTDETVTAAINIINILNIVKPICCALRDSGAQPAKDFFTLHEQ